MPTWITGNLPPSLLFVLMIAAGISRAVHAAGADEQTKSLEERIRPVLVEREEKVQSSKLKVQSSDHWAFKRVSRPSVPAVKSTGWVQTPIDAFILAQLEENSLLPASPADRRTLIRRATYDLTGLPPTAEEVDAFLQDDRPDAFAKVVDRLLSPPRYGERWGRYWLDVARYADTKGYVYGDREESRFVQSAAYRDWVIRALNEDMAYDRFLLLQIAADQVGEKRETGSSTSQPATSHLNTETSNLKPSTLNPDLAALGFLTLGRRFLGVVHDIIDDRIDVMMRGTQALTVGCARCHDHKFDPIPIKDYYSLYGVFAGCSERLVPLASGGTNAVHHDYEKGLRERTEKYQQTYQKRREEFSNRFRAKTADYLVAVLDVRKLPSEEFYEIRGPDDINPTVVRSWENYLLSTKNDPHHVFAPWHEFMALPAGDFATKAPSVLKRITEPGQSTFAVNRLVLQALEESPLKSLRDAAERYGKLLAGVHQHWQTLAQTALTNRTELPRNLPDPAEEELRQVLYGSNAPVNIPELAAVDLEWYFDEPARVELMKLHSEIERWIIKSD
ncbi:MAG: DUF1549 domain-containing protein, partial [Verrucomicrobiales bacterium]|nr:DUF1549 domain-containing protein [Verrucomicrobiales bacterium]